MKRQHDSRFQTHIAEPRWQVIVSIAIVALLAIVEILILLKAL